MIKIHASTKGIGEVAFKAFVDLDVTAGPSANQ
jgi:hypothetical protein